MQDDPQKKHVQPPLPEQQQDMPGYTGQMDPRPDHGEESYRRCCRTPFSEGFTLRIQWAKGRV